MKSFAKILSFVLLSVMLLAAFAACTPNAPDGVDSTLDSSAEPPTTFIEEATPVINEGTTTSPESTKEPETTAPVSREIAPEEIQTGVLYYSAGNRFANIGNGKVYVFKYVEGMNYYLTSSLIGQDPGFPLVIYFDKNDKKIGTEFENKPSQTISAEEDILHIPAGTAYFYVNARGVEAFMYSSSDKPQTTHATTEARTEPEANPDPNFIAPDEVKEAMLYYSAGNRFSNIANGKVYVYKYVEGRDYYLTSALIGQDSGFPLVIYFDKNDKKIGTQFENTPGKRVEAVEDKLNIPAGTAYFYVNARSVDAVMVSAPDSPNASVEKTKQISILFVGNSLTQDAVAYLPYILVNNYPEIDFKFYMWYCGGFDLTKTYDYFTANTPCEIFSVSENKQSWSNTSKTMKSILSEYTFDIVCMQEYFNYKGTFTESALSAWNNCCSFIKTNYKGTNELKFVTLLHAPKRDNAESIFNLTVSGCKLILEKTEAESVIAPGIAVKNAMGTDLKKLGDVGNLSPDGTHTQEGLPCVLQAYVVLQWLLDRVGLPNDISALDVKITTAVYNKLNIPGANLGSGVVSGSDADNKLALEVAVAAYKQAIETFKAN